MAIPRLNRATVVEVSETGNQKPLIKISNQVFTEGKLSIRRIGREAIFSMETASGSTELARAPCPSNDVRNVEVWSTRLEKGNAPAELLFKKLTIRAEAFYSYQKQRTAWNSNWRVWIATNFFGLVLLLIWRSRKSQSVSQ
jgi:hypothetical protein